MEWLLAPPTAAAASALRGEVTAFLRRHADSPDTVDDAALIVSELLGNAVQHAGGPVWVTLDWSTDRPELVVHDLGATVDLADLPAVPDTASIRGRGLWLVSRLSPELDVVAKRGDGKRIRTVLPVRRRVEPSFDPPRRQVNPLPALDEAGPDGFGREPFLRALVVELARTAENSHGPASAEQMVAQVGATVGGQMEQEYRRAREVAGRLTPGQLAECYLRLKSAIDGDFYVISVDEDRIVLGNRRCPFGDTVRRAPALCRMTSSVFGGVAARNHGEAVVLLDERIAVGDPECRVTVLLGPAARDNPGGHHYRDGS
ncbi:methanogen output domain 1-containing protein [Micromonospora mirobrigensis]|uniref:Anti-sigma regulatory factor (Ser/Thr protein kinase) n=1 Tax=Micromonospora mirobrigensis TaxID=262898 RepID=A0A1C4WLN8_9ACTN|nr:methanogen output domain 1-containing protein [Micromonospora mirobrigensis]SCE97120.1 Anti-sigma regulatory factor (Ser/Thr protein kinase) [Micromonospora mirobrigensis]